MVQFGWLFLKLIQILMRKNFYLNFNVQNKKIKIFQFFKIRFYISFKKT